VDDDGEVEDCDSCAARQAEIERLRARVAQLEAANASLRQAVTNRDYERPPTTNERRAAPSLSQEMPWWRSAPGCRAWLGGHPRDDREDVRILPVGSMLDQS